MFSRFDGNRLNRGIKYSRKIRIYSINKYWGSNHRSLNKSIVYKPHSGGSRKSSRMEQDSHLLVHTDYMDIPGSKCSKQKISCFKKHYLKSFNNIIQMKISRVFISENRLLYFNIFKTFNAFCCGK